MSEHLIGTQTDARLRRKPLDVRYNRNTLDAGGSLAVSHRELLGSYVQDKDNLPTMISRVTSGGSQVYSNGVVTMNVNAVAGAHCIAQSFQRHPYYAGVPQFIELTFDNFQLQTGIIKEVGYFQGSQTAPHNTNYDGIYLESNGVSNTFNFCIAKNDTITRIAKTAWNIDRLDGTGNTTNPSGINADFSKFTVAVLEFLYLGGAACRLGFIFESVGIVWVHSFAHVNTFTGTFIKSPVHPIRWSIYNSTGASTGAFGQICGTVCTLGNVSAIGQYRAAFDTDGTLTSRTSFINANSAGTTYMLRALRINPTAINTTIVGLQPTAFASTADDIWISLLANPTVTGLGIAPATWETLPNSNIQYAYGDTVTTAGAGSTTRVTNGGINLFTVPLSGIARETTGFVLDFNRRPGISIAGVSQTIVLSVTPTVNGTNADVFGSINFIEV